MKTITFSVPDSKEAMAFYSAVAQGQRGLSARSAHAMGMTRREYEQVRRVFIDYGFAVFRNNDHPQRGIVLTSAGDILVFRLAEDANPPTD